MKELYPLTFNPILKEVIWGGHRIEPFKGVERSDKLIGESWEISQIPGATSIVAEGPLKGESLDALIAKFNADLVGKHVYEKYQDNFPLLIKFIDASKDLSIQVHPNDEIAKERHDSFGKTEMWYVVDASEEASLKTGFSESLSKEEFIKKSSDGTIAESLKTYNVKKGDVFYLPAGRVHAICSGCFVAEIQQSSNITYRIFDYKRKDKFGKERELHTDLAVDVIDFNVQSNYKTEYKLLEGNDQRVEVVKSPYFLTSIIQVVDEYKMRLKDRDSFTILMVVEGSVKISVDGYKKDYPLGSTILIPACAEDISFSALSKSCKIMECYIP